MSEKHLLVRVQAKAGAVDKLLGLLADLQARSREESGNLLYQVYQDKQNVEMIYIQEAYADKVAFIEHAQSDYMAQYLRDSESLVEQVNMHSVNAL